MRTAQDITAVDADNFWELLPEVLERIAAAEYIGLDLEMTGVRLKEGISGRQEKVNIDQYYAAGVEAATAFQILEVGITCLRYGSENSECCCRLASSPPPTYSCFRGLLAHPPIFIFSSHSS